MRLPLALLGLGALVALALMRPDSAQAQALVTQCQTDFGGATTTDGQECVARYGAVLYADNYEQGRTTACYAAGNCPTKFKSPSPAIEGIPANWGTVLTGEGVSDGSNTLSAFTPSTRFYNAGEGCPADCKCAVGAGLCNPVSGNGFNNMVVLGGGSQRHLFFRYYFTIGTDFNETNLAEAKIWETHNSSTSSSQLFLGHYNAGDLKPVIRRDEAGAPLTQNSGAQLAFVPGQPMCLEFDVTMNTEGNADGALFGYINDTLKFNYPTVMLALFHGGPQNIGYFRITNSGMNGIPGASFGGGHRYVDRVVVATQRIGCSPGAAGGGLNVPANLLLCRGVGCTPAMIVPLGVGAALLAWARRRLRK